MKPIEKCNDCDRWRYTHARSSYISDRDLICTICQSSVLLKEQNDLLEGQLVEIRSNGQSLQD